MPGTAGAPIGGPLGLFVSVLTIGAERSLICVTFLSCFPFAISPNRPACEVCQLLHWYTTSCDTWTRPDLLCLWLHLAEELLGVEDHRLVEEAEEEEDHPSWVAVEEGEVVVALCG